MSKLFPGYNEITVSDRLYLHEQIRAHARQVLPDIAGMVRAATYWESFPENYTAEQVAAGRELHIAGRARSGSVEWANALIVVRELMSSAVAS